MKRFVALAFTTLAISSCSDSDSNSNSTTTSTPEPKVERKSTQPVNTMNLEITGDLEQVIDIGMGEDDEVYCDRSKKNNELSFTFRKGHIDPKTDKVYWPEAFSLAIPPDSDLNSTIKFKQGDDGFRVMLHTLAEGLWYEDECSLEMQHVSGVLDFRIECLGVKDQTPKSNRKINYVATGACVLNDAE